jgi:hypothetical protein
MRLPNGFHGPAQDSQEEIAELPLLRGTNQLLGREILQNEQSLAAKVEKSAERKGDGTSFADLKRRLTPWRPLTDPPPVGAERAQVRIRHRACNSGAERPYSVCK